MSKVRQRMEMIDESPSNSTQQEIVNKIVRDETSQHLMNDQIKIQIQAPIHIIQERSIE
jgi:hypothetical protein